MGYSNPPHKVIVLLLYASVNHFELTYRRIRGEGESVMFKSVFAIVVSVLFVEDPQFHGRSLQRLWYIAALAAMFGLSCLSGN